MTMEEPGRPVGDARLLPRVLAGVVIVGAVVAGVAVIALVVFGDEGGGSATLGSYMSQVDAEMKAISEESGAAQVQTADAVLPALASVLKNNGQDIEQLAVPGEARDEHEALVQALFDGSEAILVLSRNSPQITDIDAIPDMLANDADVTAASQAAFEACLELQQIANDNHVDVTLSLCAPVAAPTAAE